VTLVALCLTGCFIPDDYDPCHGFCPDAQYYDAGPAPDMGSLGGALGPTHQADPAPPALSGGTLLVARARPLAVLGDPDGDTVRVIDTSVMAQVGQLALSLHDDPGRAVEDASGLVHVVLRGAGAVATFDLSEPSAPVVVARRDVCPVPRGIAYDAPNDRLHVACMGGELVTLTTTGPIERTVTLASDLRDVVTIDGGLLVTRFRSSQLLVVDPLAGTVTSTIDLPSMTSAQGTLTPGVAWRVIASGAGAFVVHQLAGVAPGWGHTAPSCGTASVQAAVTSVSGDRPNAAVVLPCATLAIDAAISADARSIAIAVAGAPPLDACHPILVRALSGAIVGPPRSLDCLGPRGRVVAVAWGADGTLFAQTRAPLGLFVVPTRGMPLEIQLPGGLILDTGLDAFHAAGADHLACASCHPEGGEDGRRWTVNGEPLRTIGLRGGVSGTAPFGWHGQLASFDAVIDDMLWHPHAGGTLEADQTSAMEHWLDAQPAWTTPRVDDPDAVTRGRTLFASAGCTDCHAGPSLSNESTIDVSTHGAFQVPSLLGLGYRAPYFHDGCAATLADVLGSCGGPRHDGSALDAAQRADLALYLSSL